MGLCSLKHNAFVSPSCIQSHTLTLLSPAVASALICCMSHLNSASLSLDETLECLIRWPRRAWSDFKLDDSWAVAMELVFAVFLRAL